MNVTANVRVFPRRSKRKTTNQRFINSGPGKSRAHAHEGSGVQVVLISPELHKLQSDQAEKEVVIQAGPAVFPLLSAFGKSFPCSLSLWRFLSQHLRNDTFLIQQSLAREHVKTTMKSRLDGISPKPQLHKLPLGDESVLTVMPVRVLT